MTLRELLAARAAAETQWDRTNADIRLDRAMQARLHALLDVVDAARALIGAMTAAEAKVAHDALRAALDKVGET